MKYSKPAAIFFDWDGTLVDSFSFLEAAHNHVLAQYDLPIFEKGGFEQYFGKPREEIYPALYGDKADEARGVFEGFVRDNHKRLLEPMVGAFKCLEAVHDAGIPMGVVSNKLPDFVNAEIDHFGWRPFFKSSVGAREAAQDKPSAAPLILGLERSEISVDMADVWYVGDTHIDQKCAVAAGATFVFIDHDDVGRADGMETAPDITLKNCQDLADLVLQCT